MASPLSDPFSLLERLQQSVMAGDWVKAEGLAQEVSLMAPPSTPEKLAGYLQGLKDVLISARVSRADMVNVSRRLGAASEYTG